MPTLNTSTLATPAQQLAPAALTPAAFAAFGTVLQAPPGPGHLINAGTSERFDLVDDLCLGQQGGRAQMALFRAQARRFPVALEEMERHQLGSQSFIPLGRRRFVIVVAAAGLPPQASDLRAFVSNGLQGVTLAPGTWHHALMAVDAGDFLVVERASSAADCDTWLLTTPPCLQWSPED